MRFGKKNKYPMPIPSHVKCSWLGGFPHPLVSRPPVDPDSWEMCVCCPLLLTISMGKKYRMFSCFFSYFIGQFHETSRLRLFFPTGNEEEKRYSRSRFSYCFTILNFSFFFFRWRGDDKRKKLIATLGWWGSFKLRCRMTHHMRLVIMMCGGLTTLKGMCPASHSSRRGIKDAWPRRDVVLATPNVVVKFCVGRRQPTDFRISKRQFKPTQLLSLSPRLDDSLSPSECSLKMQIGI
jgi:hypothetical protein